MQPNCKPAKLAVHLTRFGFRSLMLLFVALLLFISPLAAKAQGPSSFWIAPYQPQNGYAVADNGVEAATVAIPLKLVVDTDPGVDDATALAWLLSQPEAKVFGIVTVAGNTTVENATKNVLTVLKQLGNPNIKVVMGAKKPLTQKLGSTGKLIHGLDGLWGQQDPTVAAAFASVAKDPRAFYCTTAMQHPGTMILALGPLTNIAQAIRHCPDSMKLYSKIVLLGGAKFGGNASVVAESNFRVDPDAAQIVLKSGLKIDMLPLDGFTQLGFTPADLSTIAASSRPVLQLLAPALFIFAGVQLQAGVPAANIPDLAAAIYALKGLGTATSSLVQVMDSPDPVRGQSIIGLAPTEKVTMIASDKELDEIANNAFPPGSNLPDPVFVGTQIGAILARVPDNANVIMNIDEVAMHDLFMNFVTTVAAAESQFDPNADHIYLPSITGQ